MQILLNIIVFLPLLLSITNGLLLYQRCIVFTKYLTSIAMIISSCIAVYAFYLITKDANIYHLKLMKWINFDSIQIYWAIYFDQLTAIMFVVVTIVSTVVHIYSIGYMNGENIQKFLSFLSLFTFFMLMLVASDNFIQLFFGWEGVGLCSYLLIGYWYHKESANKAAIKAFMTNRVADIAFIIGIIIIAYYTNALDFHSVFAKSTSLSLITIDILGSQWVLLDVILLLLFIGCMGKSAQIGLHIWLPDAMEGPTPVSALIHAATMVTAGVFLITRCSYLFEHSRYILDIILIIGALTCAMAATIAIVQSDIKKIIAYSTCSQLGYMFMACGISSYNGAMFHLATHAFFKALLFLSAGNVIHACNDEQDIFKMGGLFKKMPITYINFWIGSLAIIGIFPFAGYYSKDFILESIYSSNHMIFYHISVLVAVLTAIYSMKIILLVFHGKSNTLNHAHEMPRIMNLPLIALVFGSIFAGMIGVYCINIESQTGYFGNAIFYANATHVHIDEILIKYLPMIAGLIGIIIALCIYRNSNYNFVSKLFGPIYLLLKRKYYFDELYNAVIIKPLFWLTRTSRLFDQKFIDDFIVHGLIKLTKNTSSIVTNIQTGYITNYVLASSVALLGCIAYLAVIFYQ
ncbi:MAG: NADH-quinone oxidoreductase subunit L [Rickettsiaceae bacterium]